MTTKDMIIEGRSGKEEGVQWAGEGDKRVMRVNIIKRNYKHMKTSL